MALTDNLVSYWKLDESSGNAADSVGGQTAVNTNATYAAGKINNAAILDAASSAKMVVTQSATVNFAGDISVQAWVRVKTAATAFGGLIDKGRDGYNGWSLCHGETSTRFSFKCRVGNTNKIVTAPGNYSEDTWYHLVGVHDRTNLILYINGTAASAAASGVRNTNAVDINFAYANDTAGGYQDIDLDEVALWNRALTSDEVTELYNSGAGLQYPFSVATRRIFNIS